MLSLLAFIVLLGVLITAHEAGHFIVAKLSGVRVHTFSVGFGQAIISKTIGETEYRIAWIPLGGYVRLHGMEKEFGDLEQESDDLSDLSSSQSTDNTLDPDFGRGIGDKPPWIKILIFIAGPVMNLILPFVILTPFYYFSSDFDQVHSSTIGALDQGLPAYQSGLRDGDRITHINDTAIYSFWQVAEIVDSYHREDPPLQIEVQRPGIKDPINAVVHPQEIKRTDPLLGFVRSHHRIGFQPFTLASDIVLQNPQGILARAGAQNFDRILEIQGKKVTHFYEIYSLIQEVDDQEEIKIKIERLQSLDSQWRFLKHKMESTLTLKPKAQWIQFNGKVTATEVTTTKDHIAKSLHKPLSPLHTQTEVDTKRQTVKLHAIQDALSIYPAHACISSIDPQTTVAQVLQVGDCIVAVDGEKRSLTAFIDQSIRHQPSQEKSLDIIRQGKVIPLKLKLQQDVHQDPLAGEVKTWRMGFTFFGFSRTASMNRVEQVDTQQRSSFSWYQAKSRIKDELIRSLQTLGGMFAGQVSPTQLSGPLTIFYLAGQQAEAGISQFLYLMALISLSIALINLLPVPGLDGGHILIASIELVIRRPLPMKAKMVLQSAGVLFILCLVFFALGNDLIRMWRLSQ